MFAPLASLAQQTLAVLAAATEQGSELAEPLADSLANGAPVGVEDLPGLSVGWGGYFQAIGTLFLLLAILAGFVYLLKRFGPKAGIGFLGKGMLQLEAQLPLGPRRSVAVVRFLNKRLVVGVTEHQINLLHETDLDNEESQSTFKDTLKKEADSPSSQAES